MTTRPTPTEARAAILDGLPEAFTLAEVWMLIPRRVRFAPDEGRDIAYHVIVVSREGETRGAMHEGAIRLSPEGAVHWSSGNGDYFETLEEARGVCRAATWLRPWCRVSLADLPISQGGNALGIDPLPARLHELHRAVREANAAAAAAAN